MKKLPRKYNVEVDTPEQLDELGRMIDTSYLTHPSDYFSYPTYAYVIYREMVRFTPDNDHKTITFRKWQKLIGA